MLLDYLVTSRARRRLLGVLSGGEGEQSVRRLAARAGVGYASAHAEVGRLQRLGLVCARREGAALLCRWDSTHPRARLVRRLLEDKPRHGLGKSDQADEEVLLNLKRWGAPLVKEGSPARRWTLEETLARSLALARRNATVAQVLPGVLARSRGTLDLDALERRARRQGQKRALGFFLALCSRLTGDRRWAERAERLRDGRVRRMEDFFVDVEGPRGRRLADRNTPPLARRWLFRMNMPIRSFESAFRKFAPAP